jgi:hypothetical protein
MAFDELITRPEESYRLWCVVVCDLETSRMRRPWPALGRSATEKKYMALIIVFPLIIIHKLICFYCTFMSNCLSSFTFFTYACTHTLTHSRTLSRIHAHAHASTHTITHSCTRSNIHAHAHTFTLTHARARTHTHTHTHTQTNKRSPPSRVGSNWCSPRFDEREEGKRHQRAISATSVVPPVVTERRVLILQS